MKIIFKFFSESISSIRVDQLVLRLVLLDSQAPSPLPPSTARQVATKRGLVTKSRPCRFNDSRRHFWGLSLDPRVTWCCSESLSKLAPLFPAKSLNGSAKMTKSQKWQGSVAVKPDYRDEPQDLGVLFTLCWKRTDSEASFRRFLKIKKTAQFLDSS
jgi:hypothetical protein